MQIILERLALLNAAIKRSTKIDSYRVFHGRGRCFPDLEFITIDYYQPVILITLFAEPPVNVVAELQAYISREFENGTTLLLQRRYLQGLPVKYYWAAYPKKFSRGAALWCLICTWRASKTAVFFWI